MIAICCYIFLWSIPFWLAPLAAKWLIDWRRRRLLLAGIDTDSVSRDGQLTVTVALSAVLGLVGVLFFPLYLRIWNWHYSISWFTIGYLLAIMLPWAVLLTGGVAAWRRKWWGHWLLTTGWLFLLLGLPLTLPAFYFLWVLLFRVQTLNYFYPVAITVDPEPVPVK